MRNPAAYIGIDQSYTGFAAITYIPGHGIHDAMLRDYSKAKAGNGVDRLDRIESDLTQHLRVTHVQYPIAHVAIEGYNHGARNGRELSGELGYAVKRVLREYLRDPVGYPTIVPPTSVKKFCLGKPGAKSLMLKGVLKKWGEDFNDDNLADAYTLARIAACHDHPERIEHKYEQEVLEKLTWHTERGLTENAA